MAGSTIQHCQQVERIDALLPQTQCTRCGYPACRPYAAAVAAGEAEINRCPPGGRATIRALASLLDRPVVPLDARFGHEQPLAVASIDEAWCIGCTLCIQACPVDAIVGAAKQMHGVLSSSCTGCELCVEPCPVDCIAMIPLEPSALAPKSPLDTVDWASGWRSVDAHAARRRFEARQSRLTVEQTQRQSADARRAAPDSLQAKRAEIRAAVRRVQHKRRTAGRVR